MELKIATLQPSTNNQSLVYRPASNSYRSAFPNAIAAALPDLNPSAKGLVFTTIATRRERPARNTLELASTDRGRRAVVGRPPPGRPTGRASRTNGGRSNTVVVCKMSGVRPAGPSLMGGSESTIQLSHSATSS